MKIQDLPEEKRPREKALIYGLDSLSDRELLALIIGSGVKGHSALEISSYLLSNFHSLNLLSKIDGKTLEKVDGLSKINSLKILTVFELAKRFEKDSGKHIKSIKTSDDIFTRFKYLRKVDKEHAILVVLNNKKQIIKIKDMYIGTKSDVQININEVLSEVIRTDSNNFILVHNHPGGTMNPSNDDDTITYALKAKSATLEIKFVDHMIISRNGFYSYKDEGLL